MSISDLTEGQFALGTNVPLNFSVSNWATPQQVMQIFKHNYTMQKRLLLLGLTTTSLMAQSLIT